MLSSAPQPNNRSRSGLKRLTKSPCSPGGRGFVLSYLQVTCLVQPPVTAGAAVDAAAAASAIAVYVEELRPDVPDRCPPGGTALTV